MNTSLIFSPLIARRMCALAVVLALSAIPAQAGLLGLTVDLEFTSGSNVASYQVDLLNLTNSDYKWDFSPDSPVIIEDGQTILAKIKNLHVEVQDDPNVTLNFEMQNLAATPMRVTVTSTTLTFTPVMNPTAFATAAVTVTDDNSDGATATGLFAGTKSFEARYSNDNFATSTAFADLVDPVTAPINRSNIGSDGFPATGSVTIPDTLSSIQSKFDFNLSPMDAASGTSNFSISGGTVVVPEPSSILLAGFGLVGLIAATRRKARLSRILR